MGQNVSELTPTNEKWERGTNWYSHKYVRTEYMFSFQGKKK